MPSTHSSCAKFFQAHYFFYALLGFVSCAGVTRDSGVKGRRSTNNVSGVARRLEDMCGAFPLLTVVQVPYDDHDWFRFCTLLYGQLYVKRYVLGATDTTLYSCATVFLINSRMRITSTSTF